MGLSGAFALLAMLLTAAGIYGLLARSIALRKKEIGIRISLGAQRGQIVSAVTRKLLLGVGLGLIVGAVLTVGLVAVIHHLLLEQQPPVVWSYLISAGVILLLAGFAGYFPLRSIMAVDPAVALRTE